MKTLNECHPKERAKVVKIHGSGATKRRIMDMGLTKGVEVFVRKIASLGDPMELNVRAHRVPAWRVVYRRSRVQRVYGCGDCAFAWDPLSFI
ncbi:FeoA family protein [uncultured Dubosiella sp.]|uniref:FeoA family protein n=1 Tax=uncultured Dubosiella sp. TaxID=1937011 RepID=UPI0027311EFE|nr:FeoA family protein [uncultured Dubosiella sp.]